MVDLAIEVERNGGSIDMRVSLLWVWLMSLGSMYPFYGFGVFNLVKSSANVARTWSHVCFSD